MNQFDADVLIVGGGLSGLSCARQLNLDGITCLVLEAADRLGGRVRTDEVDGFLLDRGFQVLLSSYPEARRVLDFDDLELKRFEPGALIRCNRRSYRFCDPWRRPQYAMAMALSPIGTLSDKLKIGRLRNRLTACDLTDIYAGPNTSTLDALRDEGFSDQIIRRFFRPFLGGVFLDSSLSVSSRFFHYVFRMFATGDAAVPARGMEAIPRQLAGTLPAGSIRTNAEAVALDGQTVTLASGEKLRGRSVVLAVEGPEANRLLGRRPLGSWRGVTCLYFAAEESPVKEPVLMLNGETNGPINNLCVISDVASGYAPPGEALISVTVLHDADESDRRLECRVRRQLVDWFGTPSTPWRHLKTYRIRHALPAQLPQDLEPVEKPLQVSPGLFVCGDHCGMASIDGALVAGRRAAEAVTKSLRPEELAAPL
jgi:phytoene dehydrogenase-like protein